MDKITAADFHDLTQVAEPRVSPDGDTVAFVQKEPDDEESYSATIHLAQTGGGETRRFTVREGVDSQPRFSPSGDRLAFVSTRGADDDRPQLWVLPTDGGEARQVTNVAGGVRSIEWSPDGTRVAFVQEASSEDRAEERDIDVPDEYEPEPADPNVVDRMVYRSAERYFEGARSQVYVVDLTDDDAVERLTDGDVDHTGPTWSGSDRLFYAVDVGEPDPDDTNEFEIVEYSLDSGETETVHSTTGWPEAISASEAGEVAYPYSPPEQSTLRQTELEVLDTDTGEVTRVTEGLDRTLGYETAPQWGADGDRVYFTTPDEGAVALWRVGPDETDPDRVVRDDWTSIDGVHVGEDVVALVRSEWDHPGDVFVTTLGGREDRRLTRVNAEYLDGRAVSRPEEVRFESDGEEVQGWLLTPPDVDESEQSPLAVEVHGGPHAMWTTSGTMFHEFQTLAARGYAVFWSNPRGSAGYGEAFLTAIERDWGDRTMRDVMAGVEAVTDREGIDESSLFLTGGSFGGYMTGWMVGQTDRFEAAASQRGLYDFTGFYGSTDWAYSLVEDDYDTTPWEEPAFLWEQSPAAHANQVDTPTLLLHSDDDYRTPANTAELFHRILAKHDVDTRLVRYPDEGHELSRSGQPGHIVDRIERIARWFDGYSEYHDAPPALSREPDAGLSAGDDGEKETTGDAA